MNFIFDYIYYRITQFYFKRDGRTGATAIVAISVVQVMLGIEFVSLLLHLLFDRETNRSFIPTIRPIVAIITILLVIFNYRKYNGTYNKFRFHWKDETMKKRRIKGAVVVFSLLLPWIPLVVLEILGIL